MLVTTNTYLSSLDVENKFSDNIIHQYLPLDIKFFIKKFLKYWRPTKVILVESEIWPNVICLANKLEIPLGQNQGLRVNQLAVLENNANSNVTMLSISKLSNDRATLLPLNSNLKLDSFLGKEARFLE